MQSLRRRVWATRFFENSVPDAFDAHFFNGLLVVILVVISACYRYELSDKKAVRRERGTAE